MTCRHPQDRLAPVNLLTGELVGQLCGVCDKALPASYGCLDCGYANVMVAELLDPLRVVRTEPCPVHGDGFEWLGTP